VDLILEKSFKEFFRDSNDLPTPSASTFERESTKLEICVACDCKEFVFNFELALASLVRADARVFSDFAESSAPV
jgi:hypothetical protein